MSERIRNCELPTDGIHFHIERVRSRTKNNDESFDASGELGNLISTGVIISGYGTENELMEKYKAATEEEKESQQDLDDFSCDEGKPHFLLHFL